MSLVFTFLCATSQVKTFSLDETSDMHKKFFGWKRIGSDGLDKTKKNDLIVNNIKEDNDQALASRKDGDKFARVRENISLSRFSISRLVRLRQKLRFQEKGEDVPRIDEIGRFQIVTTLKRFGNCEYIG